MERDFSFFGFSPRPAIIRDLKGAAMKSSRLQLRSATNLKECAHASSTKPTTARNKSGQKASSSSTSIDDNVVVLDSDESSSSLPPQISNSKALQTIVLSSDEDDSLTSIKNKEVDNSLALRARTNILRSPLDSNSSEHSKNNGNEIKDTGICKVVIPESSSDESNNIPQVAIDNRKSTHPKSQLTEATRRNIQKWLASSAEPISPSSKTITKAKTCKNLKPDDVLNELYGTQWHSSAKKNVPSNSSSNDSFKFNEFLKKYGTGTKRQLEESPVKPVQKDDFIDDDSISESSIEFYQRTLTMKTITDAAASNIGLKNVVLATRRLSFLHLESSDDEDHVPDAQNMKSDKPNPQSKKEPVSKKAAVNEDQRVFKLPKTVKQPQKEPVSKKTAVNEDRSVFKLPKTVKQPHIKAGKENIQQNICTTQKRGFMESLSELMPAAYCDPKAHDFKTNFKKKKEGLSYELFKIFNNKVFNDLLPHDLQIDWNARLLKTAGYCYNKRVKGPTGEIRSSRVELSTKVCDSADRLRDTLVHELCHAAVWVVNGVNCGHGAEWKIWAAKANAKFPELPTIARCHNYSIETKFTYRCTTCGYSIGRQSRSINVTAKRCGFCYGIFEIINNSVKKNVIRSDKTPRTPNAFSLFVKENYSSLKGSTSLKHGELMKLLGQKFAAQKTASATTS